MANNFWLEHEGIMMTIQENWEVAPETSCFPKKKVESSSKYQFSGAMSNFREGIFQEN